MRYFCFPKYQKVVRAAQAGAKDGVGLQIYVDAKTDGTSWVNYSGNYDAGGKTITAQPGEKVYFRIRVFNEGNNPASDAKITGVVSNASLVSNLTISTDDLDGDNWHFNGFHFTSGGSGTVFGVWPNSTLTNRDEGILGTITLGNNFPVGQTILTGTVTINDYNAVVGYHPSLFGHAYAEGVGNKSTIRVVVNVAAPATLPSTGKISLDEIASKIFK